MDSAGRFCRKEILLKRHLILKAVRQWFYSRDFVEIQPPVTSPAPIPESSIDLFEINDTIPKSYLLPSPELYLKPLLAQGLEKFFAICPAFRKDEKGRCHLPEFTILEWYRSHTDYEILIEDCQGIVAAASQAVYGSGFPVIRYGGHAIDLSPPFKTFTIREIFQKNAGWDPVMEKDEQRFEEDLVLKVEPALPLNRPVFLRDFPAWAASLSRLKKKDSRVCERMELYIGGLELANGFSELLHKKEQEKRFSNENRKRKNLGLRVFPAPSEFLSALPKCPPSAGMALGIDRLVMLLTNLRDIKDARLPSWI